MPVNMFPLTTIKMIFSLGSLKNISATAFKCLCTKIGISYTPACWQIPPIIPPIYKNIFDIFLLFYICLCSLTKIYALRNTKSLNDIPHMTSGLAITNLPNRIKAC